LIQRTRGGDRRVDCVANPVMALAEARRAVAAVPGGLVVVTGSMFLVGALRAHLLGQSQGTTEVSDPLP
jgi:hypothetical protein